MARKLFISVLGTGFYSHCKYKFDDFISSETRFIQLATLELLTEIGKKKVIANNENNTLLWNENDKAIILVTEESKRRNWDKTITERENNKKEIIKYIGLEKEIENKHFPFSTEYIEVKQGKDEAELWEIFDNVFNQIEENDEIYFDLTHGFRYLPMLILVLGNYAKFLKKASIKAISYGNFETMDRDNNIAPIVDLLPLSALQDWTFAAGQFLETGNVDRLVKLSKTELQDLTREKNGSDKKLNDINAFINKLNPLIDDLQTCRGLNIISGNTFKKAQNSLEKIDTTFIKPFNPILEKIKNSLSVFDKNVNINNIFAAANWCFKNKMYQQAITFLQEGVVTYVCIENNIDYKIEFERNIVNIAFNVKSNDIPIEKWKLKFKEKPTEEDKNERVKKIQDVHNSIAFQKLVGLYEGINNLRNDYNHSGIRNNPMKSYDIINYINNSITSVNSAVNDTVTKVKILINLTNHPYERWSNEQKNAAEIFGEVLDIPFPQIDSKATTEEIKTLADEYLNTILQNHKEQDVTVHVMGEMTFTFALIKMLQQNNITCIASTSNRNVKECENGKKEVEFTFNTFRQYL